MSDDIEVCPFEPPEHEVSKTVNQYIQNTTPVVSVQVSDSVQLPSKGTNRIVVAIRVFEAARKPVKTSDSAYYVRVNDQK